MSEPRSNIFAADREQRVDVFRNRKEAREELVHRLHQWESGDTILCYDKLSESGSTDRTFRPDGPLSGVETSDNSDDKAREEYHAAVERAGPGDAVFLWRAEIVSVSTEPKSPIDPGEPPLKFADLTSVEVPESALVQREVAESN